jgi:hypothetical protein
MLLAEFDNDLGAGSMLVAEDTGQSAAIDERVGDFLRDGGDHAWEIAPVECHRRAGDLPMAGWRILAVGALDRIAPLATDGHAREAFGPRTARQFSSLGEPQRGEIGEIQLGLFGDMADRVGALVAETRGVGRAADPDRIKYHENGAIHLACALIVSWTGGWSFGVPPTR